MRLQPPDQLSTALIYIAAIFMAVQAGIQQLASATKRPPVVDLTGWWAFLPLALLIIVGLRWALARPERAIPAPPPTPSPAKAQAASRQPVEAALPVGVPTPAFFNKALAGKSSAQVAEYLESYALVRVEAEGQFHRAELWPGNSLKVELVGVIPVLGTTHLGAAFYFRRSEQEKLATVKYGQVIRFQGKPVPGERVWTMEDCVFLGVA
jgi:hypothetical protein